MLLAIDAGNTNVVFALVGTDGIRAEWRIATVVARTADEYAVWLHQLMEMEGLGWGDIDRVIVASVVPQILFSLRQFARRYAGVEPLVVGEDGFRYGIEIHIPNPAEVGADRLVNAVAARARWAAPLIVLDFGTATTFDVVGHDGGYEGGVIAPGINLSVDALYQATAKLPRVAVEPPGEGLGVIGKGTIHAMRSGLFWGYVGLIDGLLGRIAAEIGEPATVVATGGLAPLFRRHTPAIGHVDADLTIKGLVLLDALNRGEKD